MPTLAMERAGQADVHLLQGCCTKAERADIVAIRLEGLRLALPENFHPQMIAVIEETRGCARILRDLADRGHVHILRVPMTLNYLNLVLPCLSRTLRDMTMYYEDKTVRKEIRWRRMYNKMKDEVEGLPLPQRFVVYNHFLTMVRRLLTQSKNFDFDALDALSGRIMRFRELRGISLMVYISPLDQGSYLLLRSFQNGAPWYALRGTHELCISREGGALQLRRWSTTAQCAKAWATLVFKTWEEMILFHCTFMSLKAWNTLTIQISPKEYKLSSERRLFQAQIIDDGFRHSLIVYEDAETKGIRLHAAVWEGELCRCPVWTAFVTHQSSSLTWLHRKSAHRLWLRDIHIYVFCSRYRSHNQRPGPAGAFELCFVETTAAAHFRDLFNPLRPPAVTAAPSSYKATVEEGDDSC
ncbi:hypothetical protein BN1708_016444 [Verticillium longisporum]|uniref:Uncharacterized protein n=1 Tax=Verticillium longisporum TaxID=100787 RepID=A0A0G4MM53_VERLO|nr:hypothetical protein BN1708_016444 [Verticillium longisporum]